jgi:hypothetical protein
MVVAAEDSFKYGPTLVGDRQAFLAMGGNEPVEPLLLVRWTHLSVIGYSHQMINICK